MAKTSGPNFIEQHVEKVVFGAALVVLFVALSLRVVSSPRKVELSNVPGFSGAGGAYSPEEVDLALGKMAKYVRERIERAQPTVQSPPPYLARLRILRDNPLAVWPDPAVEKHQALVRVTNYHNLRPGRKPSEPAMEEQEGPKIELADLLPVPAPETPLVRVRREVQVLPRTRTQQAQLREAIAAHLAAVYEFRKLMDAWQQKLQDVRVPVSFVVLQVEAQRRYLREDGSWSAPEPVSGVSLPPQTPLPLVPPYDGKNLSDVLYAVQQIARPENQQQIVEPPYYDVYWSNQQPGTWMINKPRTRVSDLLQTAGTGTPGGARPLPPAGVPSGYRMPRPGGPHVPPMPPAYPAYPGRKVPGAAPGRPMPPIPPAVEPGPTRGRGTTRRPSVPARMPRRSTRRPSAAPRMPGGRLPTARMPGARLPGGPPRMPRIPTAPPMPPQQPTPPVGPGRQPVPPRPGVGPQPQMEQPEIALVPSLQEQLSHAKGILEVWVHDTDLTEGRTYAYRVRLVLYNPLFGQFRVVPKDKQDQAKQVAVKTPWSAWSEPVAVKRGTEFFLTGRFLNQGGNVKVFTHKWGQWVEQSFRVEPGDPIGRVVSKKLRRLDTGLVETTEVDFRTGAIAVDFEFDRKKIVGKAGFTRETMVMLYQDADGKLRSRVDYEDMNCQRYKELLKWSKQTAAVVAAAVEATRGYPRYP